MFQNPIRHVVFPAQPPDADDPLHYVIVPTTELRTEPVTREDLERGRVPADWVLGFDSALDEWRPHHGRPDMMQTTAAPAPVVLRSTLMDVPNCALIKGRVMAVDDADFMVKTHVPCLAYAPVEKVRVATLHQLSRLPLGCILCYDTISAVLVARGAEPEQVVLMPTGSPETFSIVINPGQVSMSVVCYAPEEIFCK